MRKLVDCCSHSKKRINGDALADGLLLQGPPRLLRHVLPDEGAVLTWVLAIAALAAGVTGAWSPCGFSMVETLAPAGYAGRLRTTLVACATFTAGALVGGVITFGGLGLLGQWLGAGGTGAAAVAAVVAVAAAIGEARGVRIVPQVRRQVPESWRRVLPVPLAAGLYGVLLGLGFTTFILTFAVWALAAVSVALGDPALGAVLGLAFGAGRALPVIALAPVAETDRGNAAHAAMAERPAILRGLRAADAVALAACAVAMTTVAPASAATVVGALRLRPLRRGRAARVPAPGPAAPATSRAPTRPSACPAATRRSAPASSAGATPRARSCSRAPTRSTPVASYAAPGAGPFAFSDQWVVWLVGPDAARRPAARLLGAAARRRQRAQRRAARPPVDRRARPSSSTAPARPAPRSACSTSPPAARALAALRAPRAAEQPDVRRPPPALRALDLHAPGAARSGPLAPPQDDARPHPLPHHPDRAPRRRATSRATTATRRLQGRQAAAAGAAPARRRGRHAVDDGARARRRRTSRGCASGAA